MTEGSGSTESENVVRSPDADADALWKPGSPSGSSASVVTETPGVDDLADQAGALAEDTAEDTTEDIVDDTADDTAEDTVSDEVGSASPWSSESGAVFAVSSAPVFDLPLAAGESDDRSGADGDATSPSRARRRRRGAVAVVAAAALVAAGGFRYTQTDELGARIAAETARAGASGIGDVGAVASLVSEPFAGADPRRLPAQLDERWRVDVEGVSATSQTRLTVLGDGVVVGVFDDDSPDDTAQDGIPAAVVLAVDGAGGSERWRTPFDSQARAFEVLGGFGDVVVLERLDTDNRSVLGLSVDTGEVLWERETNDPGVHVALEGTQLVARVSFTANARLTFIDPASGEEIGRVPGRLFATDYLGTWYVRNGSAVSKLDLRDGWNPPTPYATLWVDDTEPATVVGGRLLAIDDGMLEALGDDGAPTGVAALDAGWGGFAGLDIGANFTQLSPMVDDAFVLVGSRSAFGAELDEFGDAAVRWSASGTPIGSRPTDRGLSIVLATEGGGSQRVIDASTGVDITSVEMVPGSIQTLQLVGNGVVVKQAALVGFERVGLDLDGNRLWSLVGDGPLAIGRGVVVTYGPSDAGVAITAYGDPAP